MNYLFCRIRRELEERWIALNQHVSEHVSEHDNRVLLIDFAGSDLQISGAATVLPSSILDSQTAAGSNFPEHDSASLDGIVICLQLAWRDPETMLIEISRVLRPGGRLLFCTFGPDTLQQLRWAWYQVDRSAHVHPFIDMRTVGDLLLQAGFTDPVVDTDWVTVEYGDAGVLYADLRGDGLINILPDRRKTLTGKDRFKEYSAKLDGLRDPGQPLQITFELIYGVATAPVSLPSRVLVTPPKT